MIPSCDWFQIVPRARISKASTVSSHSAETSAARASAVATETQKAQAEKSISERPTKKPKVRARLLLLVSRKIDPLFETRNVLLRIGRGPFQAPFGAKLLTCKSVANKAETAIAYRAASRVCFPVRCSDFEYSRVAHSRCSLATGALCAKTI